MAGESNLCKGLARSRTNSAPVEQFCIRCPENCLRNIDFLLDLPEDKRTQVMKDTYREHHEKGDFLVHEGDPVDAIYFIHKGKVKLSTYDGYGKEQIIGIFADGEAIWEGIFMDQSCYPYDAQCVSDVELLKISRKPFEKLLTEPSVSLHIIGILSRKLHNANERSRILSATEPKARVAGFLLYRLRQAEENSVTFRLSDIAASINLRPETVSRKIRELERARLIERTGQSTIHILDAEKLEEVYLS